MQVQVWAQVWREFAAKGYNLALCARRLERLETLKQSKSQFSIQVGIKTLDVTHYDDVFTVLKPFSKNLERLTELLSMQVWVKVAVSVRVILM